MAELADAIDLGSISRECRFDSCYPHQRRSKAMRSCSFFQKSKDLIACSSLFPKNFCFAKLFREPCFSPRLLNRLASFANRLFLRLSLLFPKKLLLCKTFSGAL